MSRFVALCLGGSGIAMAAALACFSERSSSPSDPGLPGEVFSVMPAVGTYDYHCRPHPFMQGQVVVQ
jgi:plastocyanin